MTDVARLAGVSQASVSLVLNKMTGARISPATRRRVLEAATEVGYHLNPRRASPDPARPSVIAYLVDEISTSLYPVVNVDGPREAAWEAGHLLQVYATRGDPELEAATIAAVVPGEVAGGFTATERLLRAGHRRIGVIAGEP